MLKIKTTKLQELVSKAIKGAGNDKNRTITALLAIKVDAGVLTLITTDAENYLYVSEAIESDDFYAVVQADFFAKLISRITSEDVVLELEGEDSLMIQGNGAHKIPVTIDATTGAIVEYPDPVAAISDANSKNIGTITATDIRTILRAVKPAIATTVDMPQYTNYWVNDAVLATDTDKVGCFSKQITNIPVLITAKVMELLDVYTGSEPMSILLTDDGKILFVGDCCYVYGPLADNIDSFAVDAIRAYVNKEYPSNCKLPKQEVLQLIDRLSLFVDIFDEDIVNIEFTAEGIEVSSQKYDSVECIPYLESTNFATMSGQIYLEMFRAQVKAQTGDSIELHYGDPKSLKLVDQANDVTSIVCLIG